ncbi:MAG: metallophosphoesterase [Bacteroidales bacterium]|nr:metallophosphoesterase [Bacteroidales bacterium]
MSVVHEYVKKIFLLLSISIFLTLGLSAAGQEEERDSIINDGPYCYLSNDTLRVMWIENSMLRKSYLLPGKANEVMLPADLPGNYKELTKVYGLKPNYRQNYKRIDSIAVISDVHGHYDTYLNHLLSNGIIDKDLNWKFGKGHLVFLGDAFDRGDQVTEILWHIFKIEKQAASVGGMVHFILGNHELMVLAGDLRYIHEKYSKVEAITGSTHSELYSENSVLGKWLRSKPVMITINNILFVHAGVSPELVQKGLKIKQVNQFFSERIIGKDIDPYIEDEELNLLSGNDGPVWYRGYFSDSTLSISSLDSILGFYGTEHIVVGHTTHRNIMILFGNRVFGVDAGIMYGQPGNMLINKNGRFYKGSISGVRTEL